jgi:AcrR family transcriptional regulator
MADIDTPQDRRCRGRPQVRPDDETRQIIYEAARHAFADGGYAATSMEAVARRAGVSTRTLYRLIPNKVSLFDGMVTDRLDRTLASVDLNAIDHAEIEEALYAALMACAELTLTRSNRASAHGAAGGRQVFRHRRNVLQKRIQRITAALADWLRVQQKRGLIDLDDIDEAAGMLLEWSLPAAAAAMFGGVPLPPRSQIEARVRRCAALFLRGCQARDSFVWKPEFR